MSGPWALQRGATVREDGIRFEVWAPLAEKVEAVWSCGGDSGCSELVRDDRGAFSGEVSRCRSGGQPNYGYSLNGGRPLPDPVSRFQPDGVHGHSAAIDPAAFEWTDAGWPGLPKPDLVLYELHVGTFSPAGTFDGVIDALGYLRDLGITAIEIMPVAQFPGARNWGYDGVLPYAVQNSYGGPDGLRRLVNAAHGRGLAVVLDVVYNHLGPEGNYLAQYGPYFTDRYKTPWGQSINFDGPDSDEVRRYFIDNALYWISEFHLDGLRLDAVHAICDFSAINILEEISAQVHALGEQLGRKTLVIVESDLNDPRLMRPPERGGYGCDASWSDDFHHAVHAALTGERAGYYADFGQMRHIAGAVRNRYAVAGEYSPFRRRRHGAPAVDLPTDRFVICTQNHDQVGNRAASDRLSTLLSFERQKLAASMCLLAPYVPLLFMGEEYGETAPFQYFVSHSDPQLIEAVRAGRSAEFAGFSWQGDVPDPAAVETFDRSRPDRHQAASGRHAQLLAMYKELMQLRRDLPSLRPGTLQIQAESDEDPPWVGWILQAGPASPLAVAFNLARTETEAGLSAPAGTWRLRFTSDDPRFGGADRALRQVTISTVQGASRFVLPPEASVLYEWEGR